MRQPHQKGSVLEDLMNTLKLYGLDEESTSKLAGVKCTEGSKELFVLNSPA